MSDVEHKTVLSAMRSSGFFASLDDETLMLIRPTAKRVTQPRGTVIFHAGEPCKGLYIVESGAVKLYKESSDAKEHVLHVAGPGDCFGEAALFLGKGYPASAAAVQDSVLILLRKDEFLQLLRDNPDISFHLMASMATWAHRLVNSIESLTLKDAGARFADYILSRVPDGEKDGTVVDLGMPKQVLASHLGMTGETLSRLLARFEEDHLATSQGRKLKVLSIEELEDLAQFGRA
ncbi:MAG: Crp/Fnr family transcriptional regulator [Armatimonadetes bacterium]|nr:Crp/Fnr family transcriptional regulator [Armatimonadota bacterium]